MSKCCICDFECFGDDFFQLLILPTICLVIKSEKGKKKEIDTPLNEAAIFPSKTKQDKVKF